MTGIFVGIIVVIGLFYLLVVAYQHYILKNSRQIIKEFNNIKDIPIDEEIKDTSKMKLSGDSLEQFKEYQKQYSDIKAQNFEEIQLQIDLINKESRSLNFFKTQNSHNDLDKMVKDTGDQIKSIQADLADLHDLEEQHQKALADFSDQYKTIRKTILAKNYLYGPASKNLDKLFADDEKVLKKFSKLTRNGNHQSASVILENLVNRTNRLSRLVEQIPPLYNNFTTEFKNQVDEITVGHKGMRSAGYNFPDDNFAESIKYIDKQIHKSLDLLKELSLDKTRNANHQINMMIEQLYDKMEEEINAKKLVDKDSKVIKAFINHARNQNIALNDELTQLNKNYDLTHHEIEDTRQLREQIKTIARINTKDIEDIRRGDAVYSVIRSHQEKAKNDLSQIEAQQRDINDSVSDLTEEEDKARATIQKYDLKLHGMNRQIENLNLPGIPDEYLDAYDVVDSEISRLFQSMNQEKISMDSINKQLNIIRRDIDNLDEKTKDLITNAVLAEEIIQYSNRYRNQSSEVALASNKALKLFGESYNYKESLAVISEALDKVEPGAAKRIADSYKKGSKGSYEE